MRCSISNASRRESNSKIKNTMDSDMVARKLDELPYNEYINENGSIKIFSDNIGIYALKKNKEKEYLISSYQATRLDFFESSPILLGKKEDVILLAKKIIPSISENGVFFIDRINSSQSNVYETIDFFGKYSNGNITINSNDGLVDLRVMKHEIVHKVLDQYMTQIEANSLFNFVKTDKRYLDWLSYNMLDDSETSIEEFIADYYASGSYEYKSDNLIDQSIDVIRRMFTGYSEINKVDNLILFFRKLNKGYYNTYYGSRSGKTMYSARNFGNSTKKTLSKFMSDLLRENKKDIDYKSMSKEEFDNYRKERKKEQSDLLSIHNVLGASYKKLFIDRISAYNKIGSQTNRNELSRTRAEMRKNMFFSYSSDERILMDLFEHIFHSNGEKKLVDALSRSLSAYSDSSDFHFVELYNLLDLFYLDVYYYKELSKKENSTEDEKTLKKNEAYIKFKENIELYKSFYSQNGEFAPYFNNIEPILKALDVEYNNINFNLTIYNDSDMVPVRLFAVVTKAMKFITNPDKKFKTIDNIVDDRVLKNPESKKEVTEDDVFEYNLQFDFNKEDFNTIMLDKSKHQWLLLASLLYKDQGMYDYFDSIIDDSSVSFADAVKSEDFEDSDLMMIIDGHKEVDSDQIRQFKKMIYLYNLSGGNITFDEIVSDFGVLARSDREDIINSLLLTQGDKQYYINRLNEIYERIKGTGSNIKRYDRFFGFIREIISNTYNKDSSLLNSSYRFKDENDKIYSIEVLYSDISKNNANLIEVRLQLDDSSYLDIYYKFNGVNYEKNLDDLVDSIREEYGSVVTDERQNIKEYLRSSIVKMLNYNLLKSNFQGFIQILNSDYFDVVIKRFQVRDDTFIGDASEAGNDTTKLTLAIRNHVAANNITNKEFNENEELVKQSLAEAFPNIKRWDSILKKGDYNKYPDQEIGVEDVKASNIKKSLSLGRKKLQPVTNPISILNQIDSTNTQILFGGEFNNSYATEEAPQIEQKILLFSSLLNDADGRTPFLIGPTVKDRSIYKFDQKHKIFKWNRETKEYDVLELDNLEMQSLNELYLNLLETNTQSVFNNFMKGFTPSGDNLDERTLFNEMHKYAIESLKINAIQFVNDLKSDISIARIFNEKSYSKALDAYLSGNNIRDFIVNYTLMALNNAQIVSDAYGLTTSAVARFKDTATFLKRSPVAYTPNVITSARWFPANFRENVLYNRFKDGFKVLVVKTDSLNLSKIFKDIKGLESLANSSLNPLDGATFYRNDVLDYMKRYNGLKSESQSHKNIVSQKVGGGYFQMKHNSVSNSNDLQEQYEMYKNLHEFMVKNDIHIITTPDSVKVFDKTMQYTDKMSINDIMSGRIKMLDKETKNKVVILRDDQIGSLNTLEQEKDEVTHAKQEKSQYINGNSDYSYYYGQALRHLHKMSDLSGEITDIEGNRQNLINKIIKNTRSETYANLLLLSEGQMPIFDAFSMREIIPSAANSIFKDLIAPKLPGFKGLLHPDFGFTYFKSMTQEGVMDPSILQIGTTQASVDITGDYNKQKEEFYKLNFETQELLKMYFSISESEFNTIDASLKPYLTTISKNILDSLNKNGIEDPADMFGLIEPRGLSMFTKEGYSEILVPDRFKPAYDKLVEGYISKGYSNSDSIDKATNDLVAYGSRIPNTSLSSNRGYKIKGFISGERVVVPSLVMSISGHDNDGDALFTHMVALNTPDTQEFLNKILKTYNNEANELIKLSDKLKKAISYSNIKTLTEDEKLKAKTIVESLTNKVSNLDGAVTVLGKLKDIASKYYFEGSDNLLFGTKIDGSLATENELKADIEEIDRIFREEGLSQYRTYRDLNTRNFEDFYNESMFLYYHNLALKAKANRLSSGDLFIEALQPIGFDMFNKTEDGFKSIKDEESAIEYMKELIKNYGGIWVKLEKGDSYSVLLGKTIELAHKGYVSIKELNKLTSFSDAKMPNIFELNGVFDSLQDSNIQGIAIGFIAKALTSYNAYWAYNGKDADSEYMQNGTQINKVLELINLSTNAFIDALKEDTVSISGIRNPQLLRAFVGGLFSGTPLYEIIALMNSSAAKNKSIVNLVSFYDKNPFKVSWTKSDDYDSVTGDEDLFEPEWDGDDSDSPSTSSRKEWKDKYGVFNATYLGYKLMKTMELKRLNDEPILNQEPFFNDKKDMSSFFDLEAIQFNNFYSTFNKGTDSNIKLSPAELFGSSLTDEDISSIYNLFELLTDNGFDDLNKAKTYLANVIINKDYKGDYSNEIGIDLMDFIKDNYKDNDLNIILKQYQKSLFFHNYTSYHNGRLSELETKYSEVNKNKPGFLEAPVSIVDIFLRIENAISFINTILKESQGNETILRQSEHMRAIAEGFISQYSYMLTSMGLSPDAILKYLDLNIKPVKKDGQLYSNELDEKTSDFDKLRIKWMNIIEVIKNGVDEDNDLLSKTKFDSFAGFPTSSARNRAILNGAGYGSLFSLGRSKEKEIKYQETTRNLIRTIIDTVNLEFGLQGHINNNIVSKDGVYHSILMLDDMGESIHSMFKYRLNPSSIKDSIMKNMNIELINGASGVLYKVDKYGGKSIQWIGVTDGLSPMIYENLRAELNYLIDNTQSIIESHKEGLTEDEKTILNPKGKTKGQVLTAHHLMILSMLEPYPVGLISLKSLFSKRSEFDYARKMIYDFNNKSNFSENIEINDTRTIESMIQVNSIINKVKEKKNPSIIDKNYILYLSTITSNKRKKNQGLVIFKMLNGLLNNNEVIDSINSRVSEDTNEKISKIDKPTIPKLINLLTDIISIDEDFIKDLFYRREIAKFDDNKQTFSESVNKLYEVLKKESGSSDLSSEQTDIEGVDETLLLTYSGPGGINEDNCIK